MKFNSFGSAAGLLPLVAMLSIAGCSKKAPPPPPPVEIKAEEPLSQDQMVEAQKMLKALGYRVGVADGVLGPKSVAAIKAFQKTQHLPEDGILTKDVLTRLAEAQAKLPKTTVSKYEVGEILTYNDGSTEQIEDLSNGIRVKANGGEQRKRRSNFLLVADADEKTDAAPDFLQPLRAGAAGEYKVFRADQPESFSTVRCSVAPPAKTNLILGTLQTYNATCVQSGAGVTKTEYEWDYAPSLYQVIREGRTVEGKEPAIRQIIAIQPATDSWPQAARTGFDWAMVHALDGDMEKSPVTWSSTGVNERFSFKVDRTPLDQNIGLPAETAGLVCLRYQMIRTDAKGKGKIYPGVACRSPQKEWSIPSRKPYVFASPPAGL